MREAAVVRTREPLAAGLVLRIRGAIGGSTERVAGRTLQSMPWRAGEPGELDVVSTAADYAARGGLVRDQDVHVRPGE